MIQQIGLKQLRNEINKTIMEKEDTGGYTLDNRRNRDNIGKKRCPIHL